MSRRIKIYISVATGICLLLLATGIWLTGYHEEIWRRSTSFRPQIWQMAINKVSQTNLLFGLGANAPSELKGNYVFDHAHSIYVATLYYGDLTGIVFLLVMIGTIIHTS